MDALKLMQKYMIHFVFLLFLISGFLGLYYRSAFVSLKFTLPIALFAMLLKPMVYMDIKKAFTTINSIKLKYLVYLTLFYTIVFPLLTYGLMKLIIFVAPGLDSRIIAAIVILGLSPIASSAPAFVGLANGKVQLTLVGVIWTFILSIFIIPFYAHWMLNSIIRVPVKILLNSIFWYVITPLAVGQAIKYIALKTSGNQGLEKLKRPLSYLSLIGLYWMVIEIFGINSRAIMMMSYQIVELIVIMYVYHIARFAIAYYAGKLSKMPMDRIVSLVYSSSINMTLSTAISIGTFGTMAGVGTIVGGPFSEMILMILLLKMLHVNNDEN